jgi:hypothetical protein
MSVLKRLGSPIPVVGLLALCLMEHQEASAAGDDDRSRAANSGTTQYKTSDIEGWTVYVKKDFLKRQPTLADRTLTLLRLQLFQITRIVPPAAVKKLRTIPFWVEEKDPSTPCMAYHPAAAWLREHGTNPSMA